MAFATSLLASLDRIRSIPGRLGLHPYTVTRITRTWSSGTIGHGTPTDVEAVLRVNGQNVHARQAAESEADHYLETGPTFVEGDWLVGPLTPEFAGGGYDPDTFDGQSEAVEIFYRIEGPGMAVDNTFKATRKASSGPFGITLTLRRAPYLP
jgi:hypothetical protein